MSYATKLRGLMDGYDNANGIKQIPLAELAGVSQGAISKILNNPEKEPEIKTLRALSDVFKVPLSWWFEDEAELPRHETGSVAAKTIIHSLQNLDKAGGVDDDVADALRAILRMANRHRVFEIDMLPDGDQQKTSDKLMANVSLTSSADILPKLEKEKAESAARQLAKPDTDALRALAVSPKAKK